ncbi:hypothetical protein M378DRAFT_373719 [Amanita muscaria Koide BX008]|uniref:Uncharacterized protein n=1 Tax=Amanita muscaria (strain Koide BX008) TaxID=946122 RepID=A0A0C2XCV7_AMAMK|nr:hypothetical protein M378DRAFT_373719 [Amanita muscaria Koide BX008]
MRIYSSQKHAHSYWCRRALYRRAHRYKSLRTSYFFLSSAGHLSSAGLAIRTSLLTRSSLIFKMVPRTIFVVLAVVCTTLQSAVACHPGAIGNDPTTSECPRMLTKRASSWQYCYHYCTSMNRSTIMGSAAYALCMRRCYGPY